jgi:hypothetical protein
VERKPGFDLLVMVERLFLDFTQIENAALGKIGDIFSVEAYITARSQVYGLLFSLLHGK